MSELQCWQDRNAEFGMLAVMKKLGLYKKPLRNMVGTVLRRKHLPSSGARMGDLCLVKENGRIYCWAGNRWADVS